MLNILRKQAQSTLIQGLVLVIAIVFIFWGVGANMNNNRNSAATVNGREISFQDFQQAYDRTVENFRKQFGGQLPPGLLESMGIKSQVLAQLIQAELLRQGGEEMGLVVSDLAVQREIQKMDVFQKDGHFDLELYKTILSQNRLTPTGFEEGLKADLERQRVTETVGGFAVVPDSGLRDWFAFTGEQIKLAYLALDPADFESKVEVKDEELAAWYEKNKEKYRSEPKVRLEYLLFNFDEDSRKIEVSEEELKERYESEKASFQQPEKRHARHILFKVAQDASDEQRAAQKKKAEEVLARAKKGEDFAKLAEEFSEGPTKSKGGDLGFFARGRMVPSFDAAVFSLQPGRISELVETPFGYHIIKLEEVRPAVTRGLDQVKDTLSAEIKKEKARGLTFKRASQTYEQIMRAGSLDKYAQSGGEKVVKTEYFTRSAPPESLVKDPAFLEQAFALNKGELSSLVELKDGYAIVFVNDIQEPEIPDLKEVRDRVVSDYTREKAVELADKEAARILADSREKGSLEKAAGPSLKVKVTDFLERSAPAGPDAPPAQVLQDGFKLSWKEKLPLDVIRVGTTPYVYEVLERRPGDEVADQGEREKVREQLLRTARNQLLNAWLAKIQERSEIWTNQTLLE